MAPSWLVSFAIAWLVLALLSAVAILAHIVYERVPMMPIMKWVWPINALYMGPIGIWAYWTIRLSGRHKAQESGQRQLFWQATFKATTHCGAGCTLGDILAEWGVFILAITITGLAIWPELIGDYLLAYLLGIVFQYFTIAPMRKLGPKDGLIAAMKADTLSLTAFEVGLFGWMLLTRFVFFTAAPLHPDSVAFWFMMQIGMGLGFITSYPVNWWLVRVGLKERM